MLLALCACGSDRRGSLASNIAVDLRSFLSRSISGAGSEAISQLNVDFATAEVATFLRDLEGTKRQFRYSGRLAAWRLQPAVLFEAHGELRACLIVVSYVPRSDRLAFVGGWLVLDRTSREVSGLACGKVEFTTISERQLLGSLRPLEANGVRREIDD